ncbi:MAG: sigma-70 family RNA polymerase sigma factor [Mycobacteriales bacterium]
MARADDSFDAAFDDLRVLAYRAAYRLLGSAADSEEIAAEALVRTYARWSKVQGHAQPWVVTVATNLALDRGRRLTVARSHERDLLGPDAVPDPYLEERLDLQAALRRLPRRQRQVVALRFLADWSARDTAQALQVDIGTVKSQTSRALAQLRTLMIPEA